MTGEEIKMLLAYVQAFDNRTVEREHVLAWNDALNRYPFEDAKEAVRRFFGTESGWIMPGDVFRLMKQVRADREREALKARAVTAAPYVPDVSHTDLKRRVKERYSTAYEDGIREGNAERAYNETLRATADPTKAHAAARAVRDA